MKSWKWEHLKNLVNKLSNHEKRYLSLHMLNKESGDQNNSHLIYQILKNNEKIDQGLLKNLVPSKNLSLEKSYFAKNLLKNLRNYHENSSLEIEIHNALCDIQILFSKQLYEYCLEYSSHYIELSYHFQFYELSIQLLKWKRKCLTRLDKKKMNRLHLEEISMLERDCFLQLSLIYKLKNVQQEILVLINKKANFLSQEDKNKCLELLKELNFDNDALKSLMGKAVYNEIQSWIAYYVNGNMALSLEFNTANYNLFKNCKHLISAYPQMFLAVYISYYSRSFLNKTENAENILKQIDEIQYSKKLNIPEDVRVQAFLFSSEIRLLLHIDKRNFKKVIEIFNQNKKVLNHNTSDIKMSYFLIQYFCVALAHFHLKQYSEALTYSKKIIDEFNDLIKLDYYYFNLILNFMIHIELGNTTIFKYLNNYFKRVIKKHKLEDPEILIYAELFERISKDQKGSSKLYADARNELIKNYEKTPKGAYDLHFENWLLEKSEQLKN